MTGADLSEKIIDGRDLSDVLYSNGSRDGETFLFMNGKQLEGYRKGNWKVKLPFKGTQGSPWRSRVAPHDTLLIDLSIDPGEKNNVFVSNRNKAIELINEMNEQYENLDLPASLVLRGPQDNSHLEYLEEKHRLQVKPK